MDQTKIILLIFQYHIHELSRLAIILSSSEHYISDFLNVLKFTSAVNSRIYWKLQNTIYKINSTDHT